MAWKVLKRVSLCIASAGVIIVALFCFYLWSTYINSVTTEGSAYGFNIGDNKEETFRKAQRILPTLAQNNRAIFVETVVTDELSSLLGVNPGFTVFTQTRLHDDGFEILRGKDRWEFYFGASYFDEISFTFCERELCEISRQRKRFELP